MTTTDFLDTVARSALSTRATIQATYDIASAVIANGTPGDFVECGVYAGANAAAMARAIIDHNFLRLSPLCGPRRLHLFDSFEGIPQAGPWDREYLEAGHKAGLSACSLDKVKANMRAWGIPDELLAYHSGPFSATIPVSVSVASICRVTGISLLRLDGDLYESTKVCMEHLYPLVTLGGWVICDDYHLSGARKAVNEVVMPGPCYWVKEWEKG